MFEIPSVIVMFMYIAPLQLVLFLSPVALTGEAKFGERPHVCAILKWEMVPKVLVNGFRSELEPRFKFSSRNL